MANTLPNLPDTRVFSEIYKNLLPAPRLGNKGMALNESILRQLRVLDEQNAVNRFEWINLPSGLTENLIERILYYRGSAIFFYEESLKQFYFLPYVGENLDVYGRYKNAFPLPFNGSTDGDKEQAIFGKEKSWEIAYDIILPEDLKIEHLRGTCVVLNDYSRQLSQKVLPRQYLQEPLMQVEAECIPFLRTALLNATGIKGVRVNNSDESYSVAQASNGLVKAGLNGDLWIPVEASINTETLTDGAGSGTAEEFLVAMQSIDNLRLAMHGIENGGLFQKKAHMLQSESDTNGGSASFSLQDCLAQRQEFCNIVNSIWGLGMWCDISEVASEGDLNGDGMIADEEDPTEGQASNDIARGDENADM